MPKYWHQIMLTIQPWEWVELEKHETILSSDLGTGLEPERDVANPNLDGINMTRVIRGMKNSTYMVGADQAW